MSTKHSLPELIKSVSTLCGKRKSHTVCEGQNPGTAFVQTEITPFLTQSFQSVMKKCGDAQRAWSGGCIKILGLPDREYHYREL